MFKENDSLSKPENGNREKGYRCENQALEYFQKKGFRLVNRNFKVARIEVDLILKKQHWLLVEVKSLRRCDEIHFRLSEKQSLRLQRARNIFQEQKNEPVQLVVAYVLPSGSVISLPIEDHL